MKILLTGAGGYIGARLLTELAEKKHKIVALVRSASRFSPPPQYASQVEVIECDLLDKDSLQKIPTDIDSAYYLVHSMAHSKKNYPGMEAICAKNFAERLSETKARQIIYLSGLSNEENLSKHLSSRKNVDTILREGKVPVTTLKAGIIIGSGSASFEIIRDLVEKIPLMIVPKWTSNLVQPIGVRDVLEYLVLVMDHPKCISKSFDIGGTEIFSYKDILLQFAKTRGLRRKIISVPLLTPKLSSYWLCLVTSASYPLASALIESLTNNAICKEHTITTIFPKKLFTFKEAVERALSLIQEDKVPSSWKDAMGDTDLNPDLSTYLEVPSYGTLFNHQEMPFKGPIEEVQKTVWSLGGDVGWLYMNWAWNLRGLIDKACGGVGIRRGRSHGSELKTGDALDFWRVIVADEKNRRLLLYAEMKVPGEAWLEFTLVPKGRQGGILRQVATFRPKGLWGRLYWHLLAPIHFFIFRGMAKAICSHSNSSSFSSSI